MSKVTMPEPFMYVIMEPDGNEAGLYQEVALITTTQAEAYADARVREALEKAAQICWEMQSSPEFGKDDKDHWLAIAERRIRALLPPL